MQSDYALFIQSSISKQQHTNTILSIHQASFSVSLDTMLLRVVRVQRKAGLISSMQST
jgi:hypothetical protein